MNDEISLSDIKDNAFFWYSYISLFRGYDEKNEINIDEALDVIDINKDEFSKWEKSFFTINDSNKTVRFVGGKLSDKMTFRIEFQENEIVYFLNNTYIGNLGGHFEAWFLTPDELVKFGNYELLFLLLLPMTGIEKQQTKSVKKLIIKELKSISIFNGQAEYITECIVNGLIMNKGFYTNDIGIVNSENHSVRNIEKYPRYRNEILELNLRLKEFTE